jgi:hypothetical protein
MQIKLIALVAALALAQQACSLKRHKPLPEP